MLGGQGFALPSKLLIMAGGTETSGLPVLPSNNIDEL